MENQKTNKYFFCRSFAEAKKGRIAIAVFFSADQKHPFATLHFYAEKDSINTDQIKHIQDIFCKPSIRNQELYHRYIKDDKHEQEFLQYINFLNIDLYIYQFQHLEKNLSEIYKIRSHLATFSGRREYYYYIESNILLEDEKNYIKENFCDKCSFIKDNESHDEFLTYCKNKCISFSMYDVVMYNCESSTSFLETIMYNLNEKDLENKQNEKDLENEQNEKNSEFLIMERERLKKNKFKFGSFATCRQEAKQRKGPWQ